MRVGDWADLVVIDPQHLDASLDSYHEADVAAYGGLSRMVNRNDQTVNAVFVSGRAVFRDGQPTEIVGRERTGGFLRAGQRTEAQVDFLYLGLWDDPEAGRRRKLYAFLMTLSHSRHQFLYPTLAEDGAAWLEGHVAAFAFFGGAPKRLVIDNLTAGIAQADRYDPRVNRAYGGLARYYGCLVDPARVARPKDKPRVERQVQYARESFFRGRDSPDLAALRAEAATWCREVAGQRRHGTTAERPLVAFHARERAALRSPSRRSPGSWRRGRRPPSRPIACTMRN